MIDAEDRDDSENYGPWPWVVGLLLGVGVMGLMFGLATGML